MQPARDERFEELFRSHHGAVRGYALRRASGDVAQDVDGSKVGVFLYCQEHGNEIATSGFCLETAERLLRNYGTDPETTAFVDGLDIFLAPQINGDGVAHSLYDSNRRKNLSNYREGGTFGDPAARNNWGVDLHRNFSQGSRFDGFVGGSENCTSGNFSGPFEFSEPETRNESWVQTTFRNSGSRTTSRATCPRSSRRRSSCTSMPRAM
jgi:murein tripeptide amidase MpaA